jgi:phosphoheptose isomerase
MAIAIARSLVMTPAELGASVSHPTKVNSVKKRSTYRIGRYYLLKDRVFQLKSDDPCATIGVMSVRQSIDDAINAIGLLVPLEPKIREAAELIESTLLSDHRVLTCGNGGSAADGSHFAAEIACRFLSDRQPFPGFSLTNDGGLLTAIGNDYSFEEVFARQLVAFSQRGDILVALSTSGQSRNIVRALEVAREIGLQSIALLGRDGGACKGLASIELIISNHSTARIQEAHKVIIHIFCELIEPALQQGRRQK